MGSMGFYRFSGLVRLRVRARLRAKGLGLRC